MCSVLPAPSLGSRGPGRRAGTTSRRARGKRAPGTSQVSKERVRRPEPAAGRLRPAGGAVERGAGHVAGGRSPPRGAGGRGRRVWPSAGEGKYLRSAPHVRTARSLRPEAGGGDQPGPPAPRGQRGPASASRPRVITGAVAGPAVKEEDETAWEPGRGARPAGGAEEGRSLRLPALGAAGRAGLGRAHPDTSRGRAQAARRTALRLPRETLRAAQRLPVRASPRGRLPPPPRQELPPQTEDPGEAAPSAPMAQGIPVGVFTGRGEGGARGSGA